MVPLAAAGFPALLWEPIWYVLMHQPCNYAGGCISLTLKFLISTSEAPSHLNVAIGPPHVIIWSGSPPHSSPLLPHPPLSIFSSTFTHGPSCLPSSFLSTHISIFTTVSPFCSMFHIMPLNPTHLSSMEAIALL